MTIKILRIDDRLIHGQIVTQWIRESGAKGILVADDKAAKDATQQMMLKIATPQGIKLFIEPLAQVPQFLKEHTGDLLVLVRNPNSARTLVEAGLEIPTINVGNISNSKSAVGRKTLLAYIHVEPSDVEDLRFLAQSGVKLDVRAVPTDRSIDGTDLLNKSFA